MAVIYDNKIKSKGALVDSFEGESMFILFGDSAPDTLKDFCYCIDVKNATEEIKPGRFVVIDGAKFKITALGDIAQRNLESLGHVTISFDGSTEATLPGTINVEKADMPKLDIGTQISIVTE